MRTLAGTLKSSNTDLNEPIINFRDTNSAQALFKYSHNLTSLTTATKTVEHWEKLGWVWWKCKIILFSKKAPADDWNWVATVQKLRMKQQFTADIWPFKLLPQECTIRICSDIFQIVLPLCQQKVGIMPAIHQAIIWISQITVSSQMDTISQRMMNIECIKERLNKFFCGKAASGRFVLYCYLQCFCLANSPQPKKSYGHF